MTFLLLLLPDGGAFVSWAGLPLITSGAPILPSFFRHLRNTAGEKPTKKWTVVAAPKGKRYWAVAAGLKKAAPSLNRKAALAEIGIDCCLANVAD